MPNEINVYVERDGETVKVSNFKGGPFVSLATYAREWRQTVGVNDQARLVESDGETLCALLALSGRGESRKTVEIL